MDILLLLQMHHMTDVSIYKIALYPLYLSHLYSPSPFFVPSFHTILFIHSCVLSVHVLRTPQVFSIHSTLQFICFVFCIVWAHVLNTIYFYQTDSSLFCAPLDRKFIKFFRSCSAVGCNKNIKDTTVYSIWIVLTWRTQIHGRCMMLRAKQQENTIRIYK